MMATTTPLQRSAYYHKHPRAFANECDLVRIDQRDKASQVYLVHAGYDRLTLARAREHVRWINGENDSWGSNRAFGAMSVADLPISVEHGPPCYLCGRAVAAEDGYAAAHPSCSANAYGERGQS